MNNRLLLENQRKRLEKPLWLLICFAMFTFWQMGFIYFMGPSLNIDGRTPLPVSMDNITAIIALAYVLCIAFMIFLPRFVIWAERIVLCLALLTVIGLFFPVGEEALLLFIYAHVFFCCFIIGFESFTIINFFTENTAIIHLTLAYGVALVLIAVVQNDFLPITFPVFRIVTVIAVSAVLFFFIKMPANSEACPQFVKKSDGLTAPKKLLTGTYIMVFISALMAVSGPAISGEIQHGVFITYLVDAAASIIIYSLYKKANIHPFRSISVCMAIGCIGFLLAYISSYVSPVAYVACVFIGIGMMPCQMLPLYGLVLAKGYPSRFITPIIIGLALGAVLVQGTMVEMFRSAANMLNLAYSVIMIILAFVYLQLEPFFLYNLNRRIPEKEPSEEPIAEEKTSESILDTLTKRELEVVDLIGYGYSNGDIAKILFISEHTVKDHTKNIYRKLEVHSRFELAALVNRIHKDK